MDPAGAPLLPLSPGLESGGEAWRAGRAAASVAALLNSRLAADDGLDALTELGTPVEGWWSVLGDIRHAASVELRLPRPGDPRGLALPRGVAATAAVGWPSRAGGSRWLIPVRGGHWQSIHLPDVRMAAADPDEIGRTLREEVVRAAHAVDLEVSVRHGDGERTRIEGIVDAWILGPPALAPERRALASTSLRILLALTRPDVARPHVDAERLERAARAGVEAAFSSRLAGG